MFNFDGTVENTTMSFTTQKTQILSDWPLVITADMVLQRQGANPAKVRARQPRLVALAERAVAEGKLLARPQVAYQILKIQELFSESVVLAGNVQFSGAGLARKLSTARYLVLAVATIGPDVEGRSMLLTKVEPSFALALDGFGTACVGALTVAMRKFFADCAKQIHLATTAPAYPGSNDWELAAAQEQLFSVVDASAIGVKLTPSFLMTPCKSVSMVIGVGDCIQSTVQPCEECGASATCRHRVAES
jgi:hypothetical protein